EEPWPFAEHGTVDLADRVQLRVGALEVLDFAQWLVVVEVACDPRRLNRPVLGRWHRAVSPLAAQGSPGVVGRGVVRVHGGAELGGDRPDDRDHALLLRHDFGFAGGVGRAGGVASSNNAWASIRRAARSRSRASASSAGQSGGGM